MLPTVGSPLWFPNSVCISRMEVMPQWRRPLWPLLSCHPLNEGKLINCSVFLQHFNQYFWRPSKHGLLSSVWCNWWPAHRPRTPLPLCQAAGRASRGHREGEHQFVVTTWEIGKLYAYFRKHYHLETGNWACYPPIQQIVMFTISQLLT